MNDQVEACLGWHVAQRGQHLRGEPDRTSLPGIATQRGPCATDNLCTCSGGGCAGCGGRGEGAEGGCGRPHGGRAPSHILLPCLPPSQPALAHPADSPCMSSACAWAHEPCVRTWAHEPYVRMGA
eukprot:363873-Chlamydomonas_euryale.AAC.13